MNYVVRFNETILKNYLTFKSSLASNFSFKQITSQHLNSSIIIITKVHTKKLLHPPNTQH